MTAPGPRPTPVIVVLGAEYREAMVEELSRRYASDDEIVAPTTMEETVDVLTDLKSGRRPVALAACEFFADGEKDIRCGSMKRVAAASGEGAGVVPLVPAFLAPDAG
ncbi:hypothetical protein ACOCJ4_02375 [Knoellia sp. CPCC 206435]|uniref:hypothetical protein n=1 Tax=Knoellia terrae TaxID=3404797 RepID=UPI003B42F3A3